MEKSRKTRRPFFHSLLPQKGDSKKRVFYKLLSLVSILMFFGCVCWLSYEFLLQPRLEDNSQDEIRNVYRPVLSSAQSGSRSGAQSSASAVASQTQDRLAALKAINPDIVGWITVPNTVIDLPVVQASASDPEFYLTHDYWKTRSSYGCVFADYRSPVGSPDSKSIVLYGHHLLSGRMFTQLEKYKSLDFYQTSPLIFFDTGEGSSEWIIFSVFLANTLPQQGTPFDYTKSRFPDDSDYLNFVYQLRIRSLYNTGVSFNAQDKILLLSTCSYEFKDFRQVVAARKVRDGEDVSGASSHAASNPKVLYPDCWYEKRGGTKPVWPATYEEGKKENLLSWQEN